MLFNSYFYIFLFLPVSIVIYFILLRRRFAIASKTWLVLASLFFYAWWNPVYTPLILGSIAFNYLMGRLISREWKKRSPARGRYLLCAGVLGNLVLLGYFKYTDFFIANLNSLVRTELPYANIVLPLGISFFTFTQIAYLVDASKGKVKEYSAANYGLFVTFFPHLLAGPIIHHKEMMPQFDRTRNKVIDPRNLVEGTCLFFIGLFKKVVIADTFAVWANAGFGNPGNLNTIEAWTISLAYTLQLYYDFSGYTDMALGSSRMFNIILPINFDRPYRSLNIQEFWRRWHITLGRFMRDYIYVPLGGSRTTGTRTIVNIMLTFFIVGLWHGAGWTFIVWGLMHGGALAVNHLWNRLHISMPKWLAWLITFNFVNASWVLFRASSIGDAWKILRAMAGLNTRSLPRSDMAGINTIGELSTAIGNLFERIGNAEVILGMLALFLPLSFLFRESNEVAREFQPTFPYLVVISLISALSVLYLGSYSEFLYFRF